MTTHGLRRQRLARRGYTMMELLILVAMLGILLLVSIPNLIGWANKMRLDGAVRQASMHLALAKMKAVAHGFPYTVTYVSGQSGDQTYSDGDGDTITVTRPTLVIEGREGALDLNGNGVVGEKDDPIVGGIADKKLVMTFPPKTYVAAPPAPLPTYAGAFPPGPIRFRANGQVDIVSGQSVVFVLYVTGAAGTGTWVGGKGSAANLRPDWFAVSVNHSGRFKTHKYTVTNRWEDV